MDIHYGRKRNGIKKELKAKIEDWLKTIDDEDVRKLAAKNTIITGGSIASMLLGEPVNDYDIYFRDKATTVAVGEYYVEKFNVANNLEVGTGVCEYTPHVKIEDLENCKGEMEERVLIYLKSAGIASESQDTYRYFEGESQETMESFAESLIKDSADKDKTPYRPVFLSQNAITLANKVQLVIRFYGSPEEIHDNYDFVHAMNYYDYSYNNLVLHPEALEALLSRTLVYKGSLYPVASVFRTKKFIERGWRITAGQQLKMMWQISELDLNNYEVIREQLTGVDMAYMWELIQTVKDVDPDKINSSYIAAIIDRIFD